METFLWVEKHRPSTINDCILPENLKKTFKDFVEDKHVPNLILSGGPGVRLLLPRQCLMKLVQHHYL